MAFTDQQRVGNLENTETISACVLGLGAGSDLIYSGKMIKNQFKNGGNTLKIKLDQLKSIIDKTRMNLKIYYQLNKTKYFPFIDKYFTMKNNLENMVLNFLTKSNQI